MEDLREWLGCTVMLDSGEWVTLDEVDEDSCWGTDADGNDVEFDCSQVERGDY
jgi:hypothetical protein